ncbi:MAG TPA: phospholipase D-like domain-containing protein [Pseudomonadales bacterium]
MGIKVIPLIEHRDWLSEQLFTDGDAYFNSLLADIARAQQRIDMTFYIFELDHIGQRFADALIAARERGVSVRLLIDGIGSVFHGGRIARLLSRHGCEVRIFHPLPFSPALFRWSVVQGNLLQKILFLLLNINQRNHYKLCMIDQHIIWSGSFNISAHHLSHQLGGSDWRDYGVRLTDDNTDDIQSCFDTLWGNANSRPMLSRLQKFRANLSLPMRLFYNRLLLFRIRHATQRIWICSAYFAPSRSLIRALLKARKNGVDVRLILPSRSDVLLFPAISQTYYRQLLRHGIRIYEYGPRILHAKVMLLDQQCWIGSTNMNHRSFYHDMELDLILTLPDTIRAVTRQLEMDMQQARPIDPQHLDRLSLRLFFARILRIFRYWL